MPPTKTQRRLAQVLKRAGPLVSVGGAAEALGMDRVEAAKVLARWHSQGWLKRVRRGLYAPVPLHALGQEQVLEDPWVIVPEVFGRSYIGGWSAAEHWGLTEQLFRAVCVFTTRPVREKTPTLQGVSFRVKHIREGAFFGTKTLWRGKTKLLLSDPHRTLLDMLDDPGAGGGIDHVADCLKAYFASSEADRETLLEYGERLGNGAVFKRLGFLADRLGLDRRVSLECTFKMSKGNARLDPALPRGRLVTRWRLWVPEDWRAPA